VTGRGSGRVAQIRLEGISKAFGRSVAVADVSLAVAPGEVLVLLGPSGCGKSTTLRIIAGLEAPDRGRVFFRDTDVTDWPPEARNIGMVFQSYALFPNMNVYENLAFGLKIRGASRPEQQARAAELLALLHIEEFSERMPTELSGGQQQRVALGRALAIRPEVLLLDEPLTALDAKLREELRLELARLLSELRITTVYVTHDQAEAMALGTRLAIMNRGRIEQVGRPTEVYRRPVNRFVAEFVGTSNIFPARVIGTDGTAWRLVWEGGKLSVLANQAPPGSGATVNLMVRPEDLLLAASAPPPAESFRAHVDQALFLGDRTRVYVRTDEGRGFVADLIGQAEPLGTEVRLTFRPGSVYVLQE